METYLKSAQILHTKNARNTTTNTAIKIVFNRKKHNEWQVGNIY